MDEASNRPGRVVGPVACIASKYRRPYVLAFCELVSDRRTPFASLSPMCLAYTFVYSGHLCLCVCPLLGAIRLRHRKKEEAKNLGSQSRRDRRLRTTCLL